jgi:hypothetical protein
VPAPQFVFRRDDGFWTIVYEGRPLPRLRHRKGLSYYAFLLARPGRVFHVVELIPAGGQDTEQPVLLGSAGEVITPEGIEKYRRDADQLRRDIAEAEGEGNAPEAERLREDLEAIYEVVRVATGLGGRLRQAGDHVERYRKAVFEALRRAREAIGPYHPDLAQHLKACIETGRLLSYKPDRTITWVMQ